MEKWHKGLDFGAKPCHTKSMKKTTLDLSAIMADYTAKVIAEGKAADARREAYRNGAAKPLPTTVWDISDRM